VVDTGKADPSKESREHVLWDEDGLLTLTGGKLTTFGVMARAALRAVRSRWPAARAYEPDPRMLDPLPDMPSARDVAPAAGLRLLGRYGNDAPDFFESIAPAELSPVAESVAMWGELRWAARAEGVVHLDDLLLRRVRLGLLLPHGGAGLLDHIRAVIQPELGWDDERWSREVADYMRLWEERYSLPFISASHPLPSSPRPPVVETD
jgi:glycerol-3-phosphate dehydrogenase